MSIGEIGGIAFLGLCVFAALCLLVRALPGDVTRSG